MTTPETPSGFSVDGIPVPLAIEAEGGAAILAHLAGNPAPATPANPPHVDEGAES